MIDGRPVATISSQREYFRSPSENVIFVYLGSADFMHGSRAENL